MKIRMVSFKRKKKKKCRHIQPNNDTVRSITDIIELIHSRKMSFFFLFLFDISLKQKSSLFLFRLHNFKKKKQKRTTELTVPKQWNVWKTSHVYSFQHTHTMFQYMHEENLCCACVFYCKCVCFAHIHILHGSQISNSVIFSSSSSYFT